MSKVTVLCQDTICQLNSPLKLKDGTILPAGETVFMLPQTIAACVLTPDGTSLARAWKNISKTGHTHSDLEGILAGCQALLARYAERLTALELWATEKGYTLPDNENL